MAVTALVALALPVALALAVYASAAGPLAVEPPPAAITTRTIAAPVATTAARANAKQGKKTSPSAATPNEAADVSGNCDEAEHANDPECLSGSSDDDSERSGSDDSDSNDSDSDNSGKGSEDSGSGGGDD